jgi:GntR family transcriptional regulator, trigonelline degradation regulator
VVRVARMEGPLLLQHVVSEIREAIVSGRIQPGQRLVELELAEELGLSRGPVREGLRQLAREGLVIMRPNRGAIVRSVAAEDVIEVYALRAALGTLALRNLLGSGRATPAFVAQLEAAAKRARAARNSQVRLVEADLEFQSMIPEASGLPRVAARFAELTAEVRMFIQVLGIWYRDVDRILSEHDQLMAAILAGDVVLAEAVWRGRFARAEREFVDLIPDGTSALHRLPWLALNDGVVHGETVSMGANPPVASAAQRHEE